MEMKEAFLKKTKMVDVHGEKKGVEEVIDFLVKPEIVVRMITASEMELPVLTLVAKELEKTFDKNSNFPVVMIDGNRNVTAKQNVGRMIKFVMSQYGYTPIDGGLSEQARIPAVSGSECFSTSGIYQKTREAAFAIEITSRKL